MFDASLLNLPAEDWSAVASWCGVVLAGAVGWYARSQVAEAKRLREEQAQPYVVAYLDVVHGQAVDLVVKNFGATAAFAVEVKISPEPRQSFGEDTPVLRVPDVIPVLVPGQEWRTMWDMGHQRIDSTLPRSHDTTIGCQDSQGRHLPLLRFTLDWSSIFDRGFMVTYEMHDAAKALREISKAVGGWREGAAAKGIAVYVRDGDERDRRHAEFRRDRDGAERETPSNLRDRVRLATQRLRHKRRRSGQGVGVARE